MERDTHATDMVFRVDATKDFKGQVFALFPHEVESNGMVTSYQHIGQHSSADYDHCIKTSRPATEEEYKSLKSELESFGYNINVVSKRNYNKYLAEYKKDQRARQLLFD
jgi:hypothetical protein